MDRREIHHTAKRLGAAFIAQYYRSLIIDPDQLHRFYRPQSRIIHGTSMDGNDISGHMTDRESESDRSGGGGGGDEREMDGKEENIKLLTSRLRDPQVRLTSTESMATLYGGVLVVVHGSININTRLQTEFRDFSHTFVLMEEVEMGDGQSKAPCYYIHNEVFKYLLTDSKKNMQDIGPHSGNQPIEGTLVITQETLPQLPGFLGIEGTEPLFALEQGKNKE